MFVEGALPGEEVDFAILKKKLSHEFGKATAILSASSARVTPRCPHFGVCGGCATQHADSRTQMAAKQRWLEENLTRIGKVRAESLLPIVYGPDWEYRNRARLSVRRVPKKGGVLVGFREKRSTYVADMKECPVLPPRVAALLPALRDVIEGLSINERMPQVEIAAADNATALVFRTLLPLAPADMEGLRNFAKAQHVHVWLQPGGPESAHPLEP
ncbi:MAG TPA: 23S rRNA (uracil(1939)-C(5))-methyltransferase, partial [Burkholderiales bacterium]|nr:23S rRNA (uracil(1939)-C(5))-methyltransferase [Burkholderiales bacterium]